MCVCVWLANDTNIITQDSRRLNESKNPSSFLQPPLCKLASQISNGELSIHHRQQHQPARQPASLLCTLTQDSDIRARELHCSECSQDYHTPLVNLNIKPRAECYAYVYACLFRLARLTQVNERTPQRETSLVEKKKDVRGHVCRLQKETCFSIYLFNKQRMGLLQIQESQHKHVDVFEWERMTQMWVRMRQMTD